MKILTAGLICLMLSACSQPGTGGPIPPSLPDTDLSIVTTGLEGRGDRAFGGGVILGIGNDAYKFTALGVESSAPTLTQLVLTITVRDDLKDATYDLSNGLIDVEVVAGPGGEEVYRSEAAAGSMTVSVENDRVTASFIFNTSGGGDSVLVQGNLSAPRVKLPQTVKK